MKKGLIITLLFMFLIATFSFMVSSVPPFQQSDTQLIISYPADDILKLNEDYTFSFHVTNSTGGLPVFENLVCNFHLYNSSGQHQLNLSTATASGSLDYEFFVAGGNFTLEEDAFYYIGCNSTAEGGSDKNPIKITNTGYKQTTAEGLGSMIFLALYIFLTGLFLFIGFKLSETENLWVLGVFFMGISVLFLIYDLYLGYVYSLNFLGAVGMDGMPEKIFFIVAIVLVAGLMISGILLIKKLPKIVKYFKRKMSNSDEDGWDNNNY